jgi:uncharacterized protein DUF2511
MPMPNRTGGFMAVALLVMWMLACGGNERSGISVSRSDLGDQWPLTIESGTLHCETAGAARFVTIEDAKGTVYAINGTARGSGRFKDGNDILLAGKLPLHMQPLVDRGLTLCR